MAPAPLTNWAGNVTFGATAVHRPETLDELRRTVAGSRRIRALGSGHSFSAVADTDGDLVRLDGLPPTVETDPGRGTATVAAGLRYAEVAAALHREGLALANLASLPHISVAGSVATGTHGSGTALACLAAAVSAIRLIGPEGDVVEISRADDPDVFPGAVVALGALGVVTHLSLDVEPSFDVAQHVRVGVGLDELTAGFDEVFGAAYSVSAFTDWRTSEARIWLKRRTDDGVPAWDGGRPADTELHPVPGMPAGNSTAQLGASGPWHQRLPHFRPDTTPSAGDELQSEWLLPRTAAAEAITAVRTLADRIAPVLHISEIRTVRADDLWLSPSSGRDSVALHFTWIRNAEAVLPVIALLDDLLMPRAARPHWGKLTTASPTAIVSAYHRAPDFAALRHRLDPTAKFTNAYLEHLFPAP
ncbi:alditol oxidase [Actinocorallia aurea]